MQANDWRFRYLLAAHGKALALVIYLLGAAAMAIYGIAGIVKTRRFAAQCAPVGSGNLLNLFERVRARIWLRRPATLLVSPEECAPMAIGIVKPRVVLPRKLAEGMSPEQLEAVLAHELGHHRRYDLWVVHLECLLMVLWWFHPVFWVVRRYLRSAREDCCDDLLLNADVADRARYCEVLLQAAARIPHPAQRARAALCISERLHPMGRRLRRIMDTTIRRPARLSLAAIAVLAVAGLAALPGVRFVEADANSQATPSVEQGLVAYYPLDGDAQDHSGNGNHGTVHGATPTADRANGANGALHFAGAKTYVEIPNSASINLHGQTSMTIGVWLKLGMNGTSPRYPRAVVWKWGPKMEEDDQFILGLAKGMAVFGLSDRASWVTTGMLPVGQWVSLAAVYDATAKEIRMYVNGDLECTRQGECLIRETSEPVYLGKGETPQQAFEGDMDEVRIYNRALSVDEIRTLYKGPGYEERKKATPAPGSPEVTAGEFSTGGEAPPEVQKEIQEHYSKADPEVQEFIRWTAANFGRSGLWKLANAYDSLSGNERDAKVKEIAAALQGDYNRGLCPALAEAGALKDARLLPGLLKVAAYHRDDADYDCRAKWMAVAALGRQEDASAVPTLVPLVDFGNKNVCMWARASLARLTGQHFGADKQAWAKWWNDAGKQPPIDVSQLKPWTRPKPAEPAATPAAGPPAAPVPVPTLDEVPGAVVFNGRYKHISRNRAIAEPLELWIKRSETQVAAYVRVPFLQSIQIAEASAQTPYILSRYEGHSDGTGKDAGYHMVLTMDDGKVLMTRRGVRQNVDNKELTVPAGASFDPNTRPDPYCAANVFFQGVKLNEGKQRVFEVYDWDITGEALAPYQIRLSNQGKEEVVVPAGKFNAHHYVLEQVTSADTWFKKQAGHLTDFWVLDNGILVRILRHREPYEVQLLDWKTPEALPGLVEKGAPVAEGTATPAATPPSESVALPGPINPPNASGAVYGEPYAMEAELFGLLVQGEGVSVQSMESVPGTWSGGKVLSLKPSGPATFKLALPCPANKANTYQLSVWCSSGPDHGMCELWANGALVLKCDLYRPDGVARVKFMAPLPLKAGMNSFEVKVTGKNAASTGYAIGLDCGGLTG